MNIFKITQCQISDSIMTIKIEKANLERANQIGIQAKVYFDKLGRYPQRPSVIKLDTVRAPRP